MNRMTTLAFLFIAINLGIGVTNAFNDQHYSDTGVYIVKYSLEQRIEDDFVITNTGETVNASDQADYNETVSGMIGFNPVLDQSGGGLLDTFGFFSFIYRGARMIISIIGTMMFGLPLFLMDIGVPGFVYLPVATVMLLVMVIGIFELVSGRVGVAS